MAIGWLTVLKSVPWGEVISNAPKVAEGAKKLWNAVAKKPPSPGMPSSGAQDPKAVARLQNQLNDLHSQMLASSELIKALAEQNTQLVRRIELNRVRVLWLGAVTAIVAIVAVWALVVTLMR